MKKYIKGLNGTLLILMIVTVVSKVLGLLRETVLAYFFGTSSIVDVFVLSTTIPCVIFGCLDAAAVAIIPIYMEKLSKDKKNADKLLNSVISWIVVISLVLIVVFELLSGKIINLFMINNANTVEYNVLLSFFRITLLTIFFNPIAQIYLSYLRCKQKSVTAQIIELLISGVQIIFIVIAGLSTNTIFLPIGYAMAQFSCMIFSYIFSKNRWFFNLSKGKEMKDVMRLIFPTFLGNTIVQINAFIDKVFASTLRTGSIAALNYSNIIKNLFYAIFTAPMINIYYPKISYNVAIGEKEKTSRLVANIINKTTFFMLPVIVFSFIFSKEIIQVLFLRGNFNYESLIQTDIAFRMYAIGIVAICLREILLRCFYAIKKTKDVIIINLINISINIILNMCLIKTLGHGGLALATSISTIVVLPIYMYILWKEGVLDIKLASLGMVKNVLYCIPAILVMFVVRNLIQFPNKFIFRIIYFGLMFLILVITYLPFLLINKNKKKITD